MLIETSKVSVIVPTKNSGRSLQRCLLSIRKQTYPHIEIIVVDGHSRDQTRNIATKHADTVIEYTGERSEARNLGARSSQGGYLLFIDSDMYLSANVVSECVKAAEASKEVAVIIPESAVGEGFWARCRELEKECYLGDDELEAARFFPRELFLALGGYDASLGPAGEDWDLTIRVRQKGCRVVRVDSLAIHDDGPLTLGAAMKKKRYYGRYLRRFLERHQHEARRRLSPVRLAYLRNLKKLARAPGRAAGLFVLKLGELLATGLGMMER